MTHLLGVYNSTHGFRVLHLADVLDETRYTSRVAGINLDWAGEKAEFLDFVGQWESTLLRIESEKDTAKYLNGGHFDRTFETLRSDHDFNELIYFSALCMKIGAKIPRKHRRYLRQLFIPSVAMSAAAKAQFLRAVDEYINGVPYRPETTGNTLESY